MNVCYFCGTIDDFINQSKKNSNMENTKFLSRLFFVLLVLVSFSTQNIQGQSSSTLLNKGLFTNTGIINTGNQLARSGQPSLHNVAIYRNRIVVDGNTTNYWKNDGEWLCYGGDDGNTISMYIYNPIQKELRFRIIINAYYQPLPQMPGVNIQSVTDTYFVAGNHISEYTGNSSGGGAAPQQGGTYQQPNSRPASKCQNCLGSGNCSRSGTVYDKYYCHGSRSCAHCYGRGTVSGTFGGTIQCSFCNGSGRCGYCRGSGMCSQCGGSGYKN